MRVRRRVVTAAIAVGRSRWWVGLVDQNNCIFECDLGALGKMRCAQVCGIAEEDDDTAAVPRCWQQQFAQRAVDDAVGIFDAVAQHADRPFVAREPLA